MIHARTPAVRPAVHRFRRSPLRLALLALAPWLAAAAQAQEQTSAPAALPPVTVTAPPDGSPTAPSVEERHQTLNRTVGSVGFVDSESYKGTYAQTLRDILADVPGVYVQSRYGQEQRLSIRGSGIARGFHGRGIEVLQDGIPNNLADGSSDFYQIDPLSLRTIEVYKGGNGLAYGATTLGGAVNFVTPTAYTAIAPNVLRLDGGSFDTIRGNAQVSRRLGDVDVLVNGTITRADGYRDHADTESEAVNANVGWRINQNVETRFYFGAYLVDQKLPGSITLPAVLNNPVPATAAAVSGDQARNTRVQRMASRTTVQLSAGTLDFDLWTIHKSLYHPIFQVIDQDGWTYGAGPRFTSTFDAAGMRNELLVGTRFVGGNNEALQFVNVGGSRGAQTVNARQNAYNLEAYAENRLWFLPQFALMTGAKLFHSEREYEDKGGLPTNPTPKYASKDYDGINPKVGVMWQPAPDVQAFVNVVRSRDVPDFSDLTQITAATTRFAPLNAQDAWTVEAGTRGRSGRFAWDLTAYRSWIDGELLQFTVNPNIPATTFNADKTVHQGLELGGSVQVLRDISGRNAGDSLTVGALWNWSDFRFDGDAQYGDNRIAGVPEHLLRFSVSYGRPDGFTVTPTVDWVPSGAFADHANTLRIPSYVVLGVQTGLQLDNGVLLFVEGRNLTDTRYVSDVGTIANARVAGTTIFYPGEGRSVFGGVRYAF